MESSCEVMRGQGSLGTLWSHAVCLSVGLRGLEVLYGVLPCKGMSIGSLGSLARSWQS